MKLFFAPAACSLAVHLALRELDLPFDLVKVDLGAHTLPDGSDYRAVVPRGYVPAIELDDGSVHTEVAALLQLVGDLDPEQALIGAPGSSRRASITEWLTFIGTELHKGFSPWLWHKETADSTREAVMTKLGVRFKEIDQRLATSPFLAGDFSVADCYAFAILNWSKLLHLPMADYPSIQAYLARLAERPAFVAAIKAERMAK